MYLSKINKNQRVVLLFFFVIFLLVLGLNNTKTFLRTDEFFYYNSCRQMVSTGNWYEPYYFGEIRFQKPILFYWLINLSFMAFGVKWFAARLVSVLAGTGIMFLLYFLARRIYDSRCALYTLAILTTISFVFRFFRLALPEATLAFFITCAFYYLFKIIRSEESQRASRNWLMIGLFLGLSMLTKGPVGIIIFYLSLLAYSAWVRDFKIIFNRRALLSFILAVAIGAAWYAHLHFTYGDKYWNFILRTEVHDRMRVLSKWSVFYKLWEYVKHFFSYAFRCFTDLLPWSAFAPFAFLRLKKRGFKKEERLLISWIAGVFLVYTFVLSYHTHYILPLAMPFALIMGSFIARIRDSRAGKWGFRFIIIMYLTFAGYIAYNFTDFASHGGYDYFASHILDEFQPRERVATGSHDFVERNLEVYINHPVERQAGNWHDMGEDVHRKFSRDRLYGFLLASEKVYLLIDKDELFEFTDKDLRNKLRVMAKGYIIKRHPKTNFKKVITEGFRKNFYHKVWLVTNK